ncbi:MAG: DUF6337 family protein [Erysipelotrichaceae bacterium]
MESLSLSIIYLAIVLYFYKKENKNAFIITPILALGAPYGILQLLVSLKDLFISVNEYHMSYLVPAISIIFLILFYFVGNLIRNFFSKEKLLFNNKDLYCNELSLDKVYKIFVITTFIFILIDFLFEVDFSIELNGVADIIKSILSYGFTGHLFNISSVILLFVFTKNCSTLYNTGKCNKLWMSIPVLWSILFILKSVKYSMFFYVCALLTCFIIVFYKKLNLKKIFMCFGTLILLYFFVYIFRYFSEGNGLDSFRLAFSSDHFSYYLFGSFYAFSKVLETGIQGDIGIGLVMAPMLNVINLFSGQPFVDTISDFISVNIGNNLSTNVFTLFGSCVYEMGIGSTIIFIIILAMIVYSTYYFFIKQRETIYIVIISYFFSTLAFSFFNCFYGVSEVWEYLLVMIIIVGVEKFLRVKSITFDKFENFKIAYISEVSIRGNNAGTKARNDVESIFKKIGFVKLNNAIASTDKPNFLYYCKTYIQAFVLSIKLLALRNTIIFCQYPIVKGMVINRVIDKLHKSNKICFIVHDINSIRYHGLDCSEIKDEIKLLNKATVVITHNKSMTKLLNNFKLNTNVVELDLFDYLLKDMLKNNKNRKLSNEVAFAGNLASNKGNFFSKLLESNKAGFKLNLYGPNYDDTIKKETVSYKGNFTPEEVPNQLDGAFGLIWDGDTLESCTSNIGEYTKYNNPHKLSLYVAAKLPVIVWEEAAIADFVKKNRIGFTVKNIYEIQDKMSNISIKEYNEYVENISKLSQEVVAGEFSFKAIIKTLNIISLIN